MKNELDFLLKELGLEREVGELIEGDWKDIIRIRNVPFNNYGFPPALIPLWSSDGPKYTGIWSHPPLKRPISYVEFVFEEVCAYEIARSWEQFASKLLYDFYSFSNGSDVTYSLAPKILGDLSEEFIHVLDIPNESYHNFLSLSYFSGKEPRYIADPLKYNGYHANPIQLPDNIDRTCSFEIEMEVILSHLPQNSRWLLPSSEKRLLVRTLVDSGEIESAWLLLNSPGWEVGDAKVSFKEIVKMANDDILSAQYDFWSFYNNGDSI